MHDGRADENKITLLPGEAERTAERRKTEDREAALAAGDPAERDRFLLMHENRILRLTGSILRASVTKSDDEWSVALLAVSEALDGWNAEKGPFWPYASIVMKSRLNDLYRKEKRRSAEIPVAPDAFDGEVDEFEPDLGTQMEVRDRIGDTAENAASDTGLRDEILEIQKELSGYGISFFDLAECSPKAEKTREGCASLIRAIFDPPPLTGEMRSSRKLPIGALLKRTGLSKKLAERHRKYLIAAALILDGDYPGLADYLSFVKKGGC